MSLQRTKRTNLTTKGQIWAERLLISCYVDYRCCAIRIAPNYSFCTIVLVDPTILELGLKARTELG